VTFVNEESALAAPSDELKPEPALAHARVRHDADDLAVSSKRPIQGRLEGLDLALSAHELREPSRLGHFDARSQPAGSLRLVNASGAERPFTANVPQSAYRLTQLASGSVEFVLSNSGHIQGLVNLPSNTKAQFFTNPNLDPNPAVWLDNATLNSGSWWPHWRKWMGNRSGAERPAATELGSPAYRSSDPARGRYVHQQ
jgi:hypothetical protein